MADDSNDSSDVELSSATASLPAARYATTKETIEALAQRELERLDVDLADRKFAAARRLVHAEWEDRDDARRQEHNAGVKEAQAVERAERVARTEDCASAIDYRARVAALLPAQENRGERWIAAVERMTLACERDADAQERIAAALEALAGKP